MLNKLAKEVEELYIKYSDDVYKYILCICRDSDKANDILQNTFLNVLKGLKGFKNNSSIKTWIFTIARNECYKFLKKNKNFVPLEENILLSNSNIENDLITQSNIKLILAFINKLDEDLRNLMILRLINELSYLEIADIIGRNEVWGRVNFLRTKKKIIEMIGADL